MNKKKVIIPIVAIIAIIVIGFGIYKLIDYQSSQKRIEQDKQSIIENKLSDEEIKYLQENKYLTSQEVTDLNNIVKDLNNNDINYKEDLTKLDQDKDKIIQINDKVTKDLTTSITTKQTQYKEQLNKIKPISNKEKEDKNNYLKQLDFKLDDKAKIKTLITKEQEINKIPGKIKKLKQSIAISKEKQLLNEAPTTLPKEDIAAFGIYDLEYLPDSKDRTSKIKGKFQPKLCSLTDAKLQTKNEYSGSIPNSVVQEFRHHTNYYLTYLNKDYRNATTVTDIQNNKVYLMYNSSISDVNCGNKNAVGGAAVVILYDYETKKIVSVVGTQSTTPIVLNDTYLEFVTKPDGSTIYVDDTY